MVDAPASGVSERGRAPDERIAIRPGLDHHQALFASCLGKPLGST
jgi:hypothetical protein